VFGNALDDKVAQLNNLLYPKLLSINSAYFDFTSCDFTTRSMTVESAKDGTSKGGTGRVAFGTFSGLVHTYTLEVSYNGGLGSSSSIPYVDVPNAYETGGAINSSGSSSSATAGRRHPATGTGAGAASSSAALSLRYTIESYYEVGRAIVVSLLDMEQLNPWSRVAQTNFGTVNGVRSWIQRSIKQLHTEQAKEDSVESHYALKRRSYSERRERLDSIATTLALPSVNNYRQERKAEERRSAEKRGNS
jgi:hypothetical protein